MSYYSQLSGSESSASKHVGHIQAAANLANVHYNRASKGGHTLSAVATALRALRESISSLQLQFGSPDSISSTKGLYGGGGQLYALIEETISVLDRTGKALVQAENDRDAGYNVDSGELASVKRKLEDQKQTIKEFCDRAQSRTQPPPVPPKISPVGLNDLTETLERVTTKMFNERGSRLGGSDDDLREQLTTELDKEGFPRHILESRKDVLEAYIHLLKTKALQNNGRVPSIRGLLEQERSPPGLPSPGSSPKDEYDRDRSSPVVQPSRIFSSQRSSSPRHHDIPRLSKPTSTGLSYEPVDDCSSSSSDIESMALISTRDLVEMDDCDEKNYPLYPPPPQFVGSGFAKNYTFSPGTSPDPRTFSLPPAGTYPVLPELPASSPMSKLTPRRTALPSLTTPPPEESLVPQRQLSLPIRSGSTLGPSSEVLSRRASNLDPDGQGKPITMDARWTKIKRSLVSPEVLEEERVRYEARPTFVAVLGVLSKDKIAELARRSAEVRAARAKRARSRDVREAEAERESRKKTNPSELDDEGSDTSSSSTGAPRPRSHNNSSNYTEGSETAARSPRSRPKPGYTADGDSSDTHEGGPQSSEAKKEPFIVSPEVNTTSPSATVQPKSILKNKNENRVRFDVNGPYEVSNSSVRSDRSSRLRPSDIQGDWRPRNDDGGMERDRERERQRREREKEREEDDRRLREKEERKRRDRDRDRDKERERDRESDLSDRYDSKYRRQTRHSTGNEDTRGDCGSHRRHSSRSRRRDDDYNRSSYRDQSRDRSPDGRSEKQRRLDRERKRQYAEAVSIAGWGGAAASLLGLLVETLY